VNNSPAVIEALNGLATPAVAFCRDHNSLARPRLAGIRLSHDPMMANDRKQ
jgi:hypothetical protein